MYVDRADKMLAKKATATEMAGKLGMAKQAVAEALRTLTKANQHMAGFGAYSSISPGRNRGSSYDTSEAHLADVCKSMDRTAWRWFFETCQVRERISSKRWEALSKKIEDLEMPEFTEAEALRVFESFADNAPDLVREAIREVFEWLQPGHWSDQYKTNLKNRFEISPKIIKGWMVERWCSGWHPNYRQEQHLHSLDRTFHLLDGEAVESYPGNFVSVFQAACTAGEDECSTRYFRAKWYKNGNMHIELLRDDLRREMNRIACDGKMELKSA